MSNKEGQKALELWAYNKTARNFIGAHKDHDVSRIGIFFVAPDNIYFEIKGDFWEEHFSERYNLKKITV
jgi:hypothetical protein